MPGRADRRRPFLVQRGPDQRVPEPQAVPGLGRHTDGARLVHRREQVRDALAQDRGQVSNREVRAEQGRRPQYLADRTGHETEPVRNRRGQ